MKFITYLLQLVFDSTVEVIIGMLITAIIPLILRKWALATKNTQDVTHPNLVRRKTIGFLNFFYVPNSLSFKVKKGKPFTDKHTGLNIFVTNVSVYTALTNLTGCDFKYQLPNQTHCHTLKDAKIGWRKLFIWNDTGLSP